MVASKATENERGKESERSQAKGLLLSEHSLPGQTTMMKMKRRMCGSIDQMAILLAYT